ncbi:hypothetical protein HHI36_005080 [Cryptolaemus montrouzieri]|uniref:Uncharacterized protein n=1 Tax=Cryptolaemus montrouzieri TaxID=559131 RepID=A0ABD2NTC0_9CUCU
MEGDDIVNGKSFACYGKPFENYVGIGCLNVYHESCSGMKKIQVLDGNKEYCGNHHEHNMLKENIASKKVIAEKLEEEYKKYTEKSKDFTKEST